MPDESEVRSALAECDGLPDGRPKVQRLESLAAEVRRTGDGPLEAEVLLALSRAYEYSAERERMAVPFARLLQLLDRFPAELGPMSPVIHWQLKWMTVGLIRNPAVPLETAQRWLDELDQRYRQRGYSPRPVHMLRWLLAQGSGDETAAAAEIDAWITAPRDQMADCQACERNDWGTWRAYLGDDAGALEYWAPLLAGQLTCAEEPHRVLAKSLLPLVRAGRAQDARDAFLRGYPLARHNVSLSAAVGGHLEFCALTGNEARGLEILAEHPTWLTDTQLDTADRLAFLTGVTVLLRRLETLGHGLLPAGLGTVAETAPALEAEVRELCSRYDARNRSMAVSTRVFAQLAQKPLLDHLPLGLPARLPPGTAPPPAAGPPAAGPPAALSALVAEARRLSAARHPHARQAWDKVAASGQDLPPDVAARVARSQAGALLPADPKAAYPALLAAATRFARLGDPARTYEARGSAALAQALAGQPEEGAAAAALVVAEAAMALAAGTLTPGEHLAVRVAEAAIALERLAATPGRSPADLADSVRLVTAALAAAEQASEPRYAATFHEMLAQLAAWQEDPDELTARLDAARACYLEAGEPWRAAVPEGILGHLALQRGDPKAAEARIREAVAHGGDLLDPGQAAHLAALLGEAIGALQRSGRHTEALAAYQQAAQLFGDLGHVVARVRCLRSAAWLQLETPEPPAPGPDAEPPGVTTMRAVLSELESLTADVSSPELDTELAITKAQLAQMLAPPPADEDIKDEPALPPLRREASPPQGSRPAYAQVGVSVAN